MNEAAFRDAEKTLWNHFGLLPAERFVRLKCTGTRVRIQEVGEGAAVLFIHGGPNSGSTWAPLLEHLHGFRCLLVDRPGTGLSEQFPVTADNLPEIGASFVSDLLDGLDLERADVAASSFGGHLALRSAAATPDRIGRMIQMACPALSQGEQVPLFQRLIGIGFVRRILNVLPPNPRANRLIMEQLGHGASLEDGRISEAFFDWYLALQRHTDTNRNDGEMIAQALGARSRLTLSDEILGSIPVPTLFLWGENDSFGGLDVARHLVEKMQDARLEVVPRAGHLPWLDDPEQTAHASVTFLKNGRAAGDVRGAVRSKPSA